MERTDLPASSLKNRALSARYGVQVLGQVVLVVDRLDRTDRLTRSAIDALIRMDVQAATALVDAVHRALVHASPVHHVDTRLSDHIRHAATVYTKMTCIN